MIIIDPGHGGRDPGAVNAEGMKEKDFALEIAYILQTLCNAAGWENRITRDDDRFVPLAERTNLANRMSAPLVSIHLNKFADSNVGGVETWCFSKKDRRGDLSAGYLLAEKIQNELAGLPFKNRGVKKIYDRRTGQFVYKKLWILRRTINPAVIVEAGFLSNPHDADLYKNPVFPAKVAWAVFRGIQNWMAVCRGNCENTNK